MEMMEGYMTQKQKVADEHDDEGTEQHEDDDNNDNERMDLLLDTCQEQQDDDDSNSTTMDPRRQDEKTIIQRQHISKRPRPRRRVVASFLISIVVAVVVVTFLAKSVTFLTIATTTPSSSSRDTTTASSSSKQQYATTSLLLPSGITKYGWVGAVEDFRRQLVDLVVETKKKEETEMKKTKSQEVVDVTPIFDVVNRAIDTFGGRAVFSQVFENLEWYYPNSYYGQDYSCDKHGIGCDWQDPWWLWHYVGAASADRLLRDGSLLLDSLTGERAHDAKSVIEEIFHIQRQRFATRTSFHIEHGFLWYYLVETMPPDLNSYPVRLANDFCGHYQTEKYYVESAFKYIGFECYHGIGHGIFLIIAMRQFMADSSQQHLNNKIESTTVVFRPKGDFILTDDSFCEAYRICENAPNDTSTLPEHACKSGIKHSYWLFSSNLSQSHDRDESDHQFEELDRRACHKKK